MNTILTVLIRHLYDIVTDIQQKPETVIVKPETVTTESFVIKTEAQ